MNPSLRKTQKALDALLRGLPDELAGLYRAADCEELLRQLTETPDPAPAWLAAKARSLRLKSHLLQTALAELEKRLSAAAEAYRTEGGTDPLRTAHAEADLALLRTRQAELALQRETAGQLVLAAELAAQQEQTAALLCSPLLQKLRKPSSEGTDLT